MSTLPQELGLLKSKHKVMTAEDCCDFKKAKLAWVFGAQDLFQEEGPENFASEFWVGPIDSARKMAEAAASEYAAWAPVIKSPSGGSSEIAVAYWEDEKLDLGMVGVLPFYDTYAWFNKTREQFVPSLTAYPEMTPLGFGDNDITQLASDAVICVESNEITPDKGRKILKFLFKTSSQYESLDDILEEIPEWYHASKPKGP